VLSAQISSTVPSAVPSILHDAPQYLLDAADRLVLIPTVHTNSTTPVKLWFRYNSAILGTTVRVPIELAADPTVQPEQAPPPVVNPASTMFLDGQTRYTMLGTGDNRVTAIGLPHGSTMGAQLMVQIPQRAANGVMRVRPVWVPSATASGTIKWRISTRVVDTATSIISDGALVYDSTTGDFEVNVPQTEVGVVIAAVAVGAWLRLNVRRLGDDPGDTYAGQVNLIGIQIDY